MFYKPIDPQTNGYEKLNLPDVGSLSIHQRSPKRAPVVHV